jgi:hypothetical protein
VGLFFEAPFGKTVYPLGISFTVSHAHEALYHGASQVEEGEAL